MENKGYEYLVQKLDWYETELRKVESHFAFSVITVVIFAIVIIILATLG